LQAMANLIVFLAVFALGLLIGGYLRLGPQQP
jgi:hypothetical protein